MKTRPLTNPQTFFALTVALLTAITAFPADTNQPTALPSDFTVKLRYGKEIVLTQAAVQTLHSNAVKLLRSSSFNSSKSATRQMQWDISKIAEDYRVTVSGSYLLVAFAQPQNIRTGGGEVTVREIIVALNENYGRRSELYTIDDEGRIICHGKYSGPIIVELLEIAKKLANDA